MEVIQPEAVPRCMMASILYYTILYYTILYYTILYYTILYYTILYYTILYYNISYYTILYYSLFAVDVPALHDALEEREEWPGPGLRKGSPNCQN